MPRILITGANGLVGQTLVERAARRPDMEIMATSASECGIRGLPPGSFLRTDITRPSGIERLVMDFQPQVVVHCAALTQVDECENHPDRCTRVNVEGTRHVARAAEKAGAKFIYLSTDFVFDGEGGPYREEDEPNPVNRYGWSKLQGEIITRGLAIPWAIVRTILVYGVVPSLSRTNLVLWIRDSLRNHRMVRVVNDQFRMPTLAGDLADGILAIIQGGKTGIYHLSGPEMLSVYDMAVRTARFFSLDESWISPVSSRTLNQPGRRPPATGFVLEKAAAELKYSPKNLDEGLNVVRLLLEQHLQY